MRQLQIIRLRKQKNDWLADNYRALKREFFFNLFLLLFQNIKFFGKKAGFTILEVTIALGITMIGLLGVASLAVQNIQSQISSKYYLIASMLAQEGLELVRNIRDENWLTLGVSWDKDINNSDGTFIIDWRGRNSIDYTPNDIDDSQTKLYRDSNNYYIHNFNSGTVTPFSRLITVTPEGTEKLKVVVLVKWQEHNRSHQYVVETYLYNWR